jgi:hypothetical protein
MLCKFSAVYIYLQINMGSEPRWRAGIPYHKTLILLEVTKGEGIWKNQCFGTILTL